ncbi:hypothetical protein KCP75_01970 [Salmonella enterica subsp. enterica]|nr:hypothetical protein KCP75_01970 [Salmonella enterica subsp. enterica]
MPDDILSGVALMRGRGWPTNAGAIGRGAVSGFCLAQFSALRLLHHGVQLRFR